jgi:hypothetical protein
LTYALNDNDMWARDNELWGDGDARSSAPPGRSSSEAPPTRARGGRGVHEAGDGGSARGLREDS